ncbi:deoxyribodipyrimidine photolyase [bacterium]|nr:deoxyribodipyrimidine photolyase [bacterium]NCQ55533.1 deoxyribodipyrimidine photolyase [Candidatus Parcubacteria bacterium]NCS67544.1 deoxyribodipyrimidine photolyase [Candidatus Peregrinibacteria bacterium]NCS96291.1 deoxyribodipyrimidine photolyase [bacterium]
MSFLTMNPPNFYTDYETILKRIRAIDPIKYAKTRNFVNGEVSYLSPYVTHGIISTKTIAEIVLEKYSVKESEKLLAELGWREFFHRVWQAEGDKIFNDLRYDQAQVTSGITPNAIIEAQTQIKALDHNISRLKETGYMHNHARMWTASVSGNVAKTHWYQPARWMYYHLLDGDLASNTLSWQWIVGSFSHKKYYTNQENLNKYSDQKERQTWLDVPYEAFEAMSIPAVLEPRTELKLENEFPVSTASPIEEADKTILLYSIWNLDPLWRQDEEGLRLLWIEPEMHKDFALSPKRWKFITHWASQIEGLKIFVGTKDHLFKINASELKIFTREYPATQSWPGKRDSRYWLYPETSGYYKNFFSYWKDAHKEIEGLKKLHQPHKSS